MMHGSMTHYANGRKKKYNVWTTTKKTVEREFVEYKPPQNYRRGDTSHIKSLNSGEHHTTKKSPMEYTGTLVKGISTMHKSNAVPIIDKQQAKEHANMRR